MAKPDMTIVRAYTRAATYFRGDLGKIILTVLLVALATLLSLAQPFPLAILFDSVFYGKHPDHWIHRLFFRVAPDGKVQQIILLAACTLLMRLIQEAINLAQGALKIEIGFNGLLRVRCDLYRKLQQLSLGYHRAHPQGDLIYRLSSDTLGFQAAYNVAQGFFVNVIMLAFMTWIMFAMNWQLALLSLSIMPVLFWTIRRYGAVLMKSATRASEVESTLTTTIQRSVASIGLVQAFGREKDEYGRFHEDVSSSHTAWARMHIQGMVYWMALSISFGLGLALILGYGGYLAYKFPAVMTVGYLSIFLQYLTTQLYDPLHKLSASGTDMRRGVAGMVRVYEVLDTEPIIKDAPDAIDLPRQSRVLQLDHVSFWYREGAPVLDDVSATIVPGQMVAFVGSSGVGKSSLLSLLPRFYDPTAGALRLDGHDLRKIKLRALRKHIALVIQENAILPASVAENIAYGRPDATPEQIRRAAHLAGADVFIEVMPQKYQTILDENGLNLSGGQRQRISIARALATEAPILVLDEPTSALDPANERMINETLISLKGDRTIILVSHRLSTVADCDRIFVMDGGRIVEQGTHESLLAQRGLYYEMARHQMKLDDAPEAETAVQGT